MRIRKYYIKSYEKGLLFNRGEFKAVLGEGRYWLNPFADKRVDIVSQRSPWLIHKDLDMIVKSGLLKDDATVIDLKDTERALVWIDGRFARVLPPGQYALWNKFKDIKVEVVDASKPRFEHKDQDVIMKSCDAGQVLVKVTVEEGFAGLVFCNGDYTETLKPGIYLFWKDAERAKVFQENMREQMLDIAGQDMMTADKTSLRMNAVVAYQVKDPLKAFTSVENATQALYREAQLVLRAAIGARDIDAILSDKDSLSGDMEAELSKRAAEFGVSVKGLGIRDVILPGDMKELFNKVTEAKKAAEANLISRREEIAAMRSQANTAKMLADNPTLMRLRELEVLERIAGSSKLNIALGEKGLIERVVNLL
jgi:regulator of protease activity HflC (stomatin/prohibitin superfamily)